ncbi:MAG: EAL domain-containing protein [Roseburia sp.]
MDEVRRITFEQFKEVIEKLNYCMDDYLYIYDMKNDLYCISENALERFAVPAKEFHHVWENHKKFVYDEDLDILKKDLDRVQSGSIDFHNLEYRWLDWEEHPVWINCRGYVTKDENGKPEFLIGCINEIGKKQKADNISGLLGESSLRKEMEYWGDGKKHGFILRIGIDNFKEINENKGMEYGDMILRKTAECIQSVLLPGQSAYRIVADEYLVLDLSNRDIVQARRMYRRLRQKISAFLEKNQYEVFYTVSAGVLDISKIENQDYLNLMKLSEFALSEAKRSGRNQDYVFCEEDYEKFIRKRVLLRKLRHSINNNFEGFETHFQPIIDTEREQLYAAETLLRYYDEEFGNVSPIEFIPILEESGLIVPVGKWVLYNAMEACSKIREKIPKFRISVNVSYVQVLKSDMLGEILMGLKKYDLESESIMIELTESGFLEENAHFIEFCEGLRDYKIPLALDDFGTGYSNFHYLSELNPNTIKIDRSFTLKALNSQEEYVLLQYMVDMSHSMSLKLCIEGIETEQELHKISQIGPDYIQGFYYGRPSSLENFEKDYVAYAI